MSDIDSLMHKFHKEGEFQLPGLSQQLFNDTLNREGANPADRSAELKSKDAKSSDSAPPEPNGQQARASEEGSLTANNFLQTLNSNFSVMDKDGNGKIDKTELAKMHEDELFMKEHGKFLAELEKRYKELSGLKLDFAEGISHKDVDALEFASANGTGFGATLKYGIGNSFGLRLVESGLAGAATTFLLGPRTWANFRSTAALGFLGLSVVNALDYTFRTSGKANTILSDFAEPK